MRHLLLAPLLLGAICLAPGLAQAHAILLNSTPADQASIPAGNRTLLFRYNSRIDRQFSRLVLQGTNAQWKLPLASDSAADTLSAQAELTPGTYVVHWQVLATDGHMTRGDVRFTVTGPSPDNQPPVNRLSENRPPDGGQAGK